MITYISLLRGINVSGQKKIKMEDLRNLYTSLGYGNVRTYIQSGNVLFETESENARQLAAGIEHKIEEEYNFSVDVFIESAEDFESIINRNPFLPDMEDEHKKLYCTFLKHEPDDAAIAELPDLTDESEQFALSGRHIYLYCPDGYGRAKLSNTFLEKKLGVPATTRNWNTVVKLHNLAREI